MKYYIPKALLLAITCESQATQLRTLYTMAPYFVDIFVIKPRVKRIMITQPFDKALISFLLCFFFYPKYVLLRLLKFLFIKRTLNFLSIINSYFVCHWNGQFNFRNFKNLFRPSLSVSFIKCFLFLCDSNMITNRNNSMITNRKFCCQGLTSKSWI